MARNGLRPVSVAGIEFDALIEEQNTMSTTIPSYPVEDGFPVSDTMVLDPLTVQMTLYISNTPVTWLYRHGTSNDRVNRICERLENLWLDKELVKVVTTDAIYKDMGITSMTIKKSKEIGYAREVSLSMQKVRITKVRTVTIPSYVLKSGETMADAGVASASSSSAKSGGSGGTGSYSSASGSSSSGSSVGSGSSSSKSKGSGAKKSQSILYGAANGLGFL